MNSNSLKLIQLCKTRDILFRRCVFKKTCEGFLFKSANRSWLMRILSFFLKKKKKKKETVFSLIVLTWLFKYLLLRKSLTWFCPKPTFVLNKKNPMQSFEKLFKLKLTKQRQGNGFSLRENQVLFFPRYVHVL